LPDHPSISHFHSIGMYLYPTLGTPYVSVSVSVAASVNVSVSAAVYLCGWHDHRRSCVDECWNIKMSMMLMRFSCCCCCLCCRTFYISFFFLYVLLILVPVSDMFHWWAHKHFTHHYFTQRTAVLFLYHYHPIYMISYELYDYNKIIYINCSQNLELTTDEANKEFNFQISVLLIIAFDNLITH